MRREYIDIHRVRTNVGQLQGVPKNPRLISKDRFRKLCKSIRELPEMTEARDLLVFPHGGEYVVIGGNMRLKAYERLKWKEVPCCVLPDDTPVERLRQMVIQDNNPFGDNDWDMLANEWDSVELNDWGFDVWQEDRDKERRGPEQKQEKPERQDNPDFFDLMLDDRVYDSDNEFDIPNLRIDGQPTSGLLLPFSAWGVDSRLKKDIQTIHFYVDDYRFEAIWKDPITVLNSGCSAVVEPNLSLFDTTPVAYGLQLIYKKRWIARYFQECGVKVYADLNVAQKFYKYNRMGIPNGYNAFATRGYADRQEYLKMEIQIAREISGKDTPNMIVYGGGEGIKEICRQDNVLYVEQFMANRARKGGNNMAKTAGGVRNYSAKSSAYNKRRTEFYTLMATGNYKLNASKFYKGGGFVVTHKEHNSAQRDENGKLIDKSDEAARKLARKGFRVYLDSERSTHINITTPDGRIEKMKMDIKTISKAGSYTIKSALEKASKQGSRAVILMQGTKDMTRQYVENQISMFQQKSPIKAREKLEYVIVVGKSGNIHRHKLK